MIAGTENLSFSYGKKQVLNSISFQGEYGSFISVLGKNGAGKSTLFKCMLGILKPDKGTVRILGKSVSDYSASELSKLIAYIPQAHNPVFSYSVADMILMGTTSSTKLFSSPGKEQLKTVDEVMDKLGLSEFAQRSYDSLSGGERQLVLIARAIAQKAKILIMDEPSSGLDFGNRIKVMQTARKLVEEGYLVIQSTHDPEQAYVWSDKILALKDGTVLAYGTPGEIICSSLISDLYDIETQILSLKNDCVRVVLPANKFN